MSKVEDFKNAPVGATATLGVSGRAMKMDGVERRWILPNGLYLDDKEMEQWDYRLDPAPAPAPTSAREALDLAWELAYPVKEGQVIPEGARYLEDSRSGLVEYTVQFDFEITPEFVPVVRTLDPLPDPEPDWLDAPAVIAVCNDRMDRTVFVRENKSGTQWVRDTKVYRWDELMDVTPLYPKGQEA